MRQKLGKYAPIAVFGLLWLVCLAWFWLDRELVTWAFHIAYTCVVLPAAIVACSFRVGRDSRWGRGRWAVAPMLGVLLMLAFYLTYALFNQVEHTHHSYFPSPAALVAGVVLSAGGLVAASRAPARPRARLMPLAGFAGACAVSLAVFWLCRAGGGFAMFYSVVFLWGVVPLAALVCCGFVGADERWGRARWAVPAAVALVGLWMPYATFSLANMLANGRFNPPDDTLVGYGAAVLVMALLGLGAGVLAGRVRAARQR